MNAEPRTVNVKVLVSKSLEIDEPEWCNGDHPGAQFKQDITHNGPTIAAEFTGPHGDVRFMEAWISQAPYGVLRPEPDPLIAVDLDGIGDLHPAQVRDLTAAVRLHLARLDRLADEVDSLRGGGQ
ncbi:DUF6907 domain-containing protein [Streptomyces sp. cg28]|uniref:DUF6907 domain-containing protein n=1 Tax=Streptomyces sp. cg28 TaxID=3403457 RepID=UPI003B20FE1B